MATEVLMELLFQVCEVYIDDILVFGKTEDEYVNNLEKILKRFVEKGITLNPDKCVFGKESVNFVGFVIDGEGATFDQTKLDSVVDFIKPNNLKELRSFVGLVNYFRDHIKDQSMVIHPLQEMIKAGNNSTIKRRRGQKPIQNIICQSDDMSSALEVTDLSQDEILRTKGEIKILFGHLRQTLVLKL